MTRNRTIRHLGAGIASLVMVAAATGCGNDDESSAPDADKPAITVGIQDFGESQVVSQVYGQHLASVGYDVDYQELGGFRDLVLTAFESGDINFTPEYAASMLEFLNDNAGEATNDVVQGRRADPFAPWSEATRAGQVSVDQAGAVPWVHWRSPEPDEPKSKLD